MNKYVCDCCGGTVNPATMRCEYCGTYYKEVADNYYKPVRIEMYQNPVNTYTACVDIDEFDIERMGAENISKIAIQQLASELSKSLIPNMVVESVRDIQNFRYKVHGMVKVVRPVNNAESWRIS